MQNPREFLTISILNAKISFFGWLGMFAFALLLMVAAGCAVAWMVGGYPALPGI